MRVTVGIDMLTYKEHKDGIANCPSSGGDVMRDLKYYHEIEEEVEEMLNGCYEPVDICGYTYDAGRALRLIDETAFRCCVCDYESENYEEVSLQDLSDEETEHYAIGINQTMYCRVEDV